MSDIEEIEAAVTQLSPEQLADFRAWFAEFEARHARTQTAALATGENADWHRLAEQNLALAYGDDELDYTIADLQKLNPAYRAS